MVSEDRLISANVLKLKIRDDVNIDGRNFAIMKNHINETPTVDAVEVVHSQWDTVSYERNGTLASYSHLCPECKYFYRDAKFNGHNYCPNCGAKMDGGRA